MRSLSVKYSTESSKSIIQICKEFGISPALFYDWKKLWGSATEAKAVGCSGSGDAPEVTMAQQADEIRRLRKELAKVHRREEILKKAALILGEEPHNNMS